MKLYFYFLEKQTIRCEECEVHATTSETYSPNNKFPTGYDRLFVMVEHDIETTTGNDNNTVILTEKNAEKAANIFRDSMNLRIQIQNRSIALSNESIKQCNKNLSMIDEWESQQRR